jgi:hypothetical protein
MSSGLEVLMPLHRPGVTSLRSRSFRALNKGKRIDRMAVTSKIEWCDATFNGWIGCQHVSRLRSLLCRSTERQDLLDEVVWTEIASVTRDTRPISDLCNAFCSF